jgi:hypothetical protein
MQKKSRLRPLRSKNLRSVGSNRPNSFRRNTSELKQGRFLTAYLTCFSACLPQAGSPDKVSPYMNSARIIECIIFRQLHERNVFCHVLKFNYQISPRYTRDGEGVNSSFSFGISIPENFSDLIIIRIESKISKIFT